MYLYSAYGLGIQSDIALPELMPGKSSIDITIKIERAEPTQLAPMNLEQPPRATDQQAILFWRDVGRCCVRNGQEIVIQAVPNVAEATLRLYILGPALGVLLQQRGLLVLHASAVQADDGAIAILGESGWGKSTMAAALHARGLNFVADDIVALTFASAECPITLPAFPRLKIKPETAFALGYSAESLLMFHPEDNRREYRIAQGFPQANLPLKAIYILAEGTHQEIERCRYQEAFPEIICHSYATSYLDPNIGKARHFRQCAMVAGCVPVYRLKRPLSIAALPEVARMVEEHLCSDETLAVG